MNELITEEYLPPYCQFCEKTGHVSMIDKSGYSSASACICGWGHRFKESIYKSLQITISQWNGCKNQIVNGSDLKYIHSEIFKLEE